MSQTANVLSFRSHVHPEEVTPALRQRMLHNINIDHMVWTGFLALLTVIVLVGMVLVDTVDKISSGLFWHAGTVITFGIWAELICFFIYERRKLFVRHQPATTAIVVRETSESDLSVHNPRALVRYLPKSGQHFDVNLLQSAKDTQEAWADLDGLSAEFERNLRVGDLITILYDPIRPSHVQIVEFEH
jgi:hypothetical protein